MCPSIVGGDAGAQMSRSRGVTLDMGPFPRTNLGDVLGTQTNHSLAADCAFCEGRPGKHIFAAARAPS